MKCLRARHRAPPWESLWIRLSAKCKCVLLADSLTLAFVSTSSSAGAHFWRCPFPFFALLHVNSCTGSCRSQLLRTTSPICASLTEDVTKQTRATAQWLSTAPYVFRIRFCEANCVFVWDIMQHKHMPGIERVCYHRWKMGYEATPRLHSHLRKIQLAFAWFTFHMRTLSGSCTMTEGLLNPEILLFLPSFHPNVTLSMGKLQH